MLRPFTPAALSAVSRLALVTALSCAMWPGTANAQPAAKPESAAPVPLGPAPAASPQVQPDGTAIFRLVMPNAASVELHLEGARDPFPMAKASDGAWRVTVPRLAPQYYSYVFKVDGTDVVDPHDVTLKTSFFSIQNLFLVPGEPPRAWEPAKVSHGVLHHHHYWSNIVGINSEYYVYTPPGFDPTAKRKYPVLYLLHGYSDDPSAWTAMGKANMILDNLIAQGKAKPMIVVMPLGYGTMEVITRGWRTWNDAELVRRNYTRFSDALFQEVMPLVKQQYPLSTDRQQHAVAGLSMGGAESLLVGLNHIDDFAYVAGFSSAPLGQSEPGNFTPSFPGITAQSAVDIDSRLKLLWISCGTEDGLFEPNQKFIAWLKEKGVKPTAIQTPGMHVWMVWRDNLTNILPLLFSK